MTWKTLSSKKIYQNRYMTVTEDELLTDHGDKVTFGIVHKNPAILIIPWDGGKLTLVGQYRHVVDLFSWEFPAGHYEHASVEAAARAELEEEAGLLANQLTPLGTSPRSVIPFWLQTYPPVLKRSSPPNRGCR